MKLFSEVIFCVWVLTIFSDAKTITQDSFTEGELASRWAPIVYLAENDPFLPSSVRFFLREVKIVDENGTTVKQPAFLNETNLPVGKSSYFLTTKEPLQCPRCTLPFFKGQDIYKDSVPVYALYRHTQNSTLEITYWFFYPYNLGKVVCIGYRFRNYCPVKCRLSGKKACYQSPNKDCPCMCQKINTCVGTEQTYGNHVGEWEHVTIRFRQCKVTWRYKPLEMYLAIHKFGRLFKWTGKEFRSGGSVIQMKHGHPVVYSAYGSHGSWPESGSFVYHQACNGELLTDHTSPGKEWQTWRNLQVIPNLKDSSKHKGQNSFLRFRGMWGNQEGGCELKSYLNFCALSDGPPSISGEVAKEYGSSKGCSSTFTENICQGHDNNKRESGSRETETDDIPVAINSIGRPSTKEMILYDVSSSLQSFIPSKAPNEALSPVWDELRKETVGRLITQCIYSTIKD